MGFAFILSKDEVNLITSNFKQRELKNEHEQIWDLFFLEKKQKYQCLYKRQSNVHRLF